MSGSAGHLPVVLDADDPRCGQASSGEWILPCPDSVTPLWLPPGAVYDDTVPALFCDFCRTFLRWAEGFRAGQPVEWDQWQLDELIRPTFGVVWESTGRRVVAQVFFCAAKGNGKTALAAAVALWGLAGSGEPNPHVDLLSVSRETADRLWEATEAFIRGHPALIEDLNVHTSRKRVTCGANLGKLQVRSGDADAEQGLKPSIAIIDELLTLKSRALFDTIETAAGKRPEGLLMGLTTPSTKVLTFARNEYDRAKRVLADRALEPDLLPVIYEADPGDDPFAEETWHKAAPALRSGFLDIEVYRRQARAAKLDPTRLHAFKVYRLALWAESGHGFLDMDRYDAGAQPAPSLPELEALPAYCGLDLAGTSDLASFCMLWYRSDGWAYAGWVHWSTEAMFEQLDEWTAGHWRTWCDSEAADVRLCAGDWIDAADVVAEVVAIVNEWRPAAPVGLDSYRSREARRLLGEAGVESSLLSSTGKAMQAANERTQALVATGRFAHSGDPVARWMAANAAVTYDSHGFPKLVKSDLQERRVRIDGMAAATMAMDRRLWWEREHEQDDSVPLTVVSIHELIDAD